MHDRSRKILSALLGSVLLLSLPLTSSAAEQANPRKMAPAWKLPNLKGRSVRLSNFRGNVVVLNFWATWCPPCRREIPALIAFQKQYAPMKVTVVGVSMDDGGAARVASFARKMGINYPIVLGDQKMAQAYGGIEALPTTFIIDRKGAVVTGMEGETNRATLDRLVKPLIKQ